MRIKLIRPTENWFIKIQEYKNEFIHHGEHRIQGSGGLHRFESFGSWLDTIHINEKKEPDNEHLPGTVYIAVLLDETKVIGSIQIRHMLNANLLEYGGHIGYAISPSERNKGYGTEMLGLALKECQLLNLEKVLITCDKENIASAKVIEKNNGVLENELFTHGVFIQRFWINL